MTWTGPRRWPGRSPTRTGGRGRWLTWREAAAGAGDLDRAEALADRPRRRPVDHRPGPAGAGAGRPGRAAAGAGDLDRAEALARAITNPDQRAQALGVAAEAAAGAGDLDRAEVLARAISSPYRRAQLLAKLAVAAAGAGDLDRAEALARAISSPDERAQALANLASKAEPSQARPLLARALTVCSWHSLVQALARSIEVL